jgi:PAS domain S-box-containing protein
MAITALADGRYLEVNEAFVQQIGYSRADVIGRTSLELGVWVTPADRAAMVAELHERQTIRNPNVCFRTKSRGVITTLYSASIIDVDGQPCVLAVVEDITARKLAEEALRESEAKFRLLAETSPCGIFIYRPNGTFCYVNPQMVAFVGYSAEDLGAMTIWDLVDPESRQFVRARGESRSRGEDVPSRYEMKIVTKDGGVRYVDFAATRTEFDGEPAFLGTAFDITANKQLERQSQERTAFLQTLVENSPFGILVGGPDHTVRFCNPAFERIFLYSAEEVIGKDPDDLIGLPEDPEAAALRQRVLHGERVRITAVRRRKDGSRVHVDLHAIPLLSGDAFTGCFGIYQDITERVTSEASLQNLRMRLTRVQDEERAYLARELHDDISQRLAVVALQLAKPTPVDIDASRTLVDEILGDINRLCRRIHPSQLEHVSLTRALTSLCDEFSRRSGIDIEFEHHDVAEQLAMDVKICLYRIVQEALRNTEQHSGADRVRVTLTATADLIQCSVIDSGHGFIAGALDGSQGLGLLSMTERVHTVGGTLSVESGSGVRIVASIPIPTVSEGRIRP